MAALRFRKLELVSTQPRIEMFTEFGTLGDRDLLRTCALPKLIRDVYGRHLENFDDVITMPPMVRFKKSKPEVVFQYGFRLFLQNGE